MRAALSIALVTLITQAGCATRAARPVELVRPEATSPPDPAATITPPADRSISESATPWRAVGRSVRGRPIETVSLGSGGRRILIVGGIHGDEPEGGRTIAGVEAYLRSLNPSATILLVRDANPDGTATRSRTNANSVDLNRNWPARNYRPGGSRGPSALSEPETRTLHDLIERFAPDLMLVCHSSHRGPFVNFDGPAAEYAVAFAAAASETDRRWRVVPDMGYPTPGSLGSFMGVDREIPILTLEFDRGHDADMAWLAMRDGLGAVLRESGALLGN